MSLLCGQCGVVRHCDWAFDYWGKGTAVTVSSGVQTPPTSLFTVSACTPSSDDFVTIGCATSGFSPPEPLKFSWTGDVSDVLQYPAVQQGGTYTAVTHARVKVADWDAKKSFTCQADYPGSTTPISGDVKKREPSVQTPPPTPPPPPPPTPKPTQPRPRATDPPRRGELPSITIYKPDKTVSDSDTVSLICEVSSTDLSKVDIIWLENGKKKDGKRKTTITEDSKSVAISYLTMTGQQYKSGTFTCAAHDPKTPNDTQPPQVSTSNKDPCVSEKKECVSKELPKPNERLYIQCHNDTLEEDEYNSLWSTASSFIFLFLFTLVYSTVLSLSKIK
ncbi:hypothetical protein SRHO_G00190770 [Serrasalmus rhombeus]